MSTFLDILGSLLIVVGIAMIYVPAAVIVAGLAVIVVSYNASQQPPKTEDGGTP